MTALKNYQTAISLSKLYKVTLRGGVEGSEQLKPNIYIDAGSVNIYGYNGATQPTAIADMTLNTENTAVEGIVPFDIIPSYIAVKQNTGTTTELIASGLRVEDLGAIA